MKKLMRRGKVHPTQPSLISDYLAFLPATILILAAALSKEDIEVLAYLITCSATSSSSSGRIYTKNNNHSSSRTSKEHQVLFTCDCFSCYMSYWVRWDSSVNRQLIHEIIEAYEDDQLMSQSSQKKNKKMAKRKKERRNNKNGLNCSTDFKCLEQKILSSEDMNELESLESVEMNDGSEELESGSIRTMLSFVGGKIWSAWSH